MKLNNKVYNILKWVLLIFVDAVITLIGSLGQIYGFDTEKIVLTIASVSTFLGVITGISNYNYVKEANKMATIDTRTEEEIKEDLKTEEVVEEKEAE